MNRLRIALVLSVVLLGMAPAHAATVVVVRPAAAQGGFVEALSRLYGELLAVGLEVSMADRPVLRGSDQPPSQAWLERVAAERGASAVMDVLGERAPVGVDVWVMGGAPGRLVVSRVVLEADAVNAFERLAIRAVEVLRPSLLEMDLAGREEARAVSSRAAAVPAEGGSGPLSRSEQLGIEAGAVALASLDGVGTALLPLLRFDWAPNPRWVAHAEVAGFGSHPTVATATGRARVAQQYGVLGGCYHLIVDPFWRPFLVLSAGVLRTSVEGWADSPKQAHSVDQWSGLVEGGVGLALRWRGHYSLAVATQIQVAAPYVAIHFLDTVVATSGHPNLLLTLTVGAWL